MGIDAAIMLTAGSAMPYTLISTVVAICFVRSSRTEIRNKEQGMAAMADLLLLAEMSEREMILRNAMMPELI
jgi:hypothetical protein